MMDVMFGSSSWNMASRHAGNIGKIIPTMFSSSKDEKDLKKLFKLQESWKQTETERKTREAKRNPPPLKIRKPKLTTEQVADEYVTLRRRVISAIADNYILDRMGRDTYKRTGSAYAVVGKFKVNSAFIDWDHELRDINTMAGGLERNRVLKALCKRLGA